MASDLLVGVIAGLFFIFMGVWNLKWPLIANFGVELRPDPAELSVPRRVIARITAVLLLLIGGFLIYVSAAAGP